MARRTAPNSLLIALILITAGARATLQAEILPRFPLDIPQSFNTSVTTKSYWKGDDLLNSPPFHLITVAPVTEYRGWAGPITHQQADDHSWVVRVYRRNTPKVI